MDRDGLSRYYTDHLLKEEMSMIFVAIKCAVSVIIIGLTKGAR